MRPSRKIWQCSISPSVFLGSRSRGDGKGECRGHPGGSSSPRGPLPSDPKQEGNQELLRNALKGVSIMSKMINYGHILSIAVVSYTSNRPQHDIGKY